MILALSLAQGRWALNATLIKNSQIWIHCFGLNELLLVDRLFVSHNKKCICKLIFKYECLHWTNILKTPVKDQVNNTCKPQSLIRMAFELIEFSSLAKFVHHQSSKSLEFSSLVGRRAKFIGPARLQRWWDLRFQKEFLIRLLKTHFLQFLC